MKAIRYSWDVLWRNDRAYLCNTWQNTHHTILYQQPESFSVMEEKIWFSSSLVDTGHPRKRGNSSSMCQDSVKAENWFAMAACSGTHCTVRVAGLCRHSLPSAAQVDASSRSPLEINKREMLYTLMTFPQWLSKTTVPLKLLCPG